MKALELTVYPKRKRPVYFYGNDPYGPRGIREQERERKLIEAKRLTNAELAAELHAQEVRVLTIEKSSPHNATGPSGYRKLEALHRFATLPHYDEVTA